MSMKKYTRSMTKGFTLVELIVVIVILGILATIAFLSFGSQSASARDSKRVTDLSNIVSKVQVTLTTGANILSLVDGNTNAITVAGKLGGNDVTALDALGTYQGWVVKYSALGINAADFSDTVAGVATPYALAAVANGGTNAFQLAAKLENDSNGNPSENGATLKWNYSPRAAVLTWTATWTVTQGSTATLFNVKITDTNSPVIGFFRTKDTITLDGQPCTINSTAKTLDSFVASCTGTAPALTDDIILFAADVSWLVWAASTATTPGWIVVDGETSPY